jgi:myo-inositol-1(or 4)-monophosphatase
MTLWTSDALLVLFVEIAEAVRRSLDNIDDWHLPGAKAGQYGLDLTADAEALRLLDEAGVGVLSEESGLRRADNDVVVVIDPVDGSTNASRGIPWFATSLCAIDAEGPLVALVENQANGTRYTAIRGEGAKRNGMAIKPSGQTEFRRSFVGLSGLPPRWLGWRQYRALGAAALDMCAVADGTLDAYIDCSPSAHGAWDYAGALLVCREAGAVVAEAQGRELLVLEHEARRTPVAAASAELLEQILIERRTF